LTTYETVVGTGSVILYKSIATMPETEKRRKKTGGTNGFYVIERRNRASKLQFKSNVSWDILPTLHT